MIATAGAQVCLRQSVVIRNRVVVPSRHPSTAGMMVIGSRSGLPGCEKTTHPNGEHGSEACTTHSPQVPSRNVASG